MKWKTKDAIYEIAKRDALRNSPLCPACGAPATVDLMDISTPTEIRFIPHSPPWLTGILECSAHCYRTDPDRYLNAVEGVDS